MRNRGYVAKCYTLYCTAYSVLISTYQYEFKKIFTKIQALHQLIIQQYLSMLSNYVHKQLLYLEKEVNPGFADSLMIL